jgi:signal transduction histidine kinase
MEIAGIAFSSLLAQETDKDKTVTSRSDCGHFERKSLQSGQSVGAPVASQETSKFGRTEAELERALAMLQATIESTDMGILAMDSDAKACYFNRRFAAMWQLPDAVSISRDCDKAKAFFENQVKNPEVFRRAIWEASTQLETDSFDVLELKDGRLFIHRASPQWLGNKVIGRVWNVWDNTQSKQAEDALGQNSTEELQPKELQPKEQHQIERSNDLKVQFVAVTCHRFRSLLNIISFSNSLLNRNLNHWTAAQNQSYFVHIQSAVEQITQLLDEIALFSESAVGKLKLQPECLDFVGFCRDLIAEIRPLSDSAQHTIEFECQEEKLMCSLDSKLVRAMVTKLLANAIQYSPAGSTTHLNLTHGDRVATLQVQDSGIGMSESDQKRLFEPFFRGSNVGDIPGTGLGLATVKNLVDLHGGEMNWVSKVDIGTIVTIRLPVN